MFILRESKSVIYSRRMSELSLRSSLFHFISALLSIFHVLDVNFGSSSVSGAMLQHSDFGGIALTEWVEPTFYKDGAEFPSGSKRRTSGFQ
jgi:hypothetical protein